jgi:hypothetical protein
MLKIPDTLKNEPFIFHTEGGTVGQLRDLSACFMELDPESVVTYFMQRDCLNSYGLSQCYLRASLRQVIYLLYLKVRLMNLQTTSNLSINYPEELIHSAHRLLHTLLKWHPTLRFHPQHNHRGARAMKLVVLACQVVKER